MLSGSVDVAAFHSAVSAKYLVLRGKGPASPLLYAGPGFFFEQLSLYIFRLFAYLYIEVRKQQNFIDVWVSVTVGKCLGACQAWLDINDVLSESRKPTTSLGCSFFL